MEKEKDCPVAVSVIVPVYNVYEWIDTCMRSLVDQTFSDFEVILIDDGSTDGSDIKCREWERKDHRVRVISKENEGLSKTRNLGIDIARGGYLVFVDPDDWVDVTYLEKLYDTILENNVGIAECDVYRVNSNTGLKTYRVCSGDMGRPYTMEEHMKYGYAAIWNCMIRRSLFIEHEIRFPDCHSPAKAIYALLIAVGGGIANVHEALYYYRKFRPGCLSERPRINKGDESAVGLQAFDILIQNFTRCGLYKKYEKTLKEMLCLRLSDTLAGQFVQREKEDFLGLVEKYHGYMQKKAPQINNHRYITLGGYNLNRILRHMDMLHDPYGRFNFSSIVSIAYPVNNKYLRCIHKNRYREIMVERDIHSLFWDVVEDIRPEYIFMDFIEERFDLVEHDGGYITQSDAFQEAVSEISDHKVIKRDSLECMELWQDGFRRFIERLEYKAPKCKIILIKNYLSEEVGEKKKKKYFEELEQIQNINRILGRYYEFVSAEYDQVVVIDVSKCRYYYTDKAYEYGAIPSHLNEVVNREIAKMIKNALSKNSFFEH